MMYFISSWKISFSSNVSPYLSIKRNIWKILFFGNDEFSLFSLRELHLCLRNTALVACLDISTTSTNNPVQKYAKEKELRVEIWPPKIMVAQYDIGIVVSFGHLIPKDIINKFPLGMINVHASLLPRWRGASPIIHSLMFGDRETGVSIMRIQPHHFDTGDIILQKTCSVDHDERLPSLYDKLGKLGASCLLETIERLPRCLDETIPQKNEFITYAPRINRNISHVNWAEQTSIQLYNLFRALYGLYHLKTSWNQFPVKLKEVDLGSNERKRHKEGTIVWIKSSKELVVQCKSGTLVIKSLAIGGKTQRSIDFYNGYLSKVHSDKWIFE